jgi:hypothetical protein
MRETPLASKSGYPKTASCACGALTVTASAPPRKAHICSCQNCQRKTGSAFSYNSFFADETVAISGPHKTWRGLSDSGRWNEVNFCPTCGSTVFSKLEALPGITAIAAGCFGDAEFLKPEKLWWSSQSHRWLSLDLPKAETQ